MVPRGSLFPVFDPTNYGVVVVGALLAPELRAAFYSADPDGEGVTRTITLWVNPVFRDTYCTARLT